MKTRRTLLLSAIALGCAVLTSAPAVEAQPQVQVQGPQAEVLIILATQCAQPSVDPKIGEMPKLGYSCYKVVDTKYLALVKGQSSSAPLPNGRTFQITTNDIIGSDKDKKYKMVASVSQPDGKSFLKLADVTAEPNKRFHVGGFGYQGGALVLAIKVVP